MKAVTCWLLASLASRKQGRGATRYQETAVIQLKA